MNSWPIWLLVIALIVPCVLYAMAHDEESDDESRYW